ncbi:MAG: glutamine amidotransferase [Sedimentitalea sp.]
MEKRALLVRHEHGPEDDRVVSFLQANGITPDIRRPFAGDSLGEVTDDLIGTVIYGGMYNAYDVDLHPFLAEEYRWIGAAMAANLPLLGICQGAQMLAHHNGAWAGASDQIDYEFGYYDVMPTQADPDFMPQPLVLAQAHFHTFDLPKGAVHLARSAAFENQAFRLGDRTYGFQFHAEQTIESFRRWQDSKTANYGKPGAQTRKTQTQLMHQHDSAQADWFYGFLTKFFGVGA